MKVDVSLGRRKSLDEISVHPGRRFGIVKPLKHARIAEKRYGGSWQDYLPVHTFFDSSKAAYAANGHRMFLHSDFGIECAEMLFGTEITTSHGLTIPVRQLGMDHMVEDNGRLNTVAEWLDRLPDADWMLRPARLSKFLDYRDDPLAAAARRYGGAPANYAAIVAFFERPVELAGARRARVVTHNSFMIFVAEQIFGSVLMIDNKPIPLRQVAEDLVLARYGFIPSLQDIAGDLQVDAYVRGRDAGHGIRERKQIVSAC